jgi:hypothetical protein
MWAAARPVERGRATRHIDRFSALSASGSGADGDPKVRRKQVLGRASSVSGERAPVGEGVAPESPASVVE